VIDVSVMLISPGGKSLEPDTRSIAMVWTPDFFG